MVENSRFKDILKPEVVLPERNLEAEMVLRQELAIGAVSAALLSNRGFHNVDSARRFLNPSLDLLHDPRTLPDYEIALELILEAKKNSSKIFVHGDYDTDGVTSAALIGKCLKGLGFNVLTMVPHRKSGFGVHTDAVNLAVELGANLFITCDCGSSSIEQVQYARDNGLKVIVTDHHPVESELPNANAVVNPTRADSKYPFAKLSGVGVALKLCAGITEAFGTSNKVFYNAFLDLAALGTIADVVPLIDENRVIVTFGLPKIWNSNHKGLKSLVNKSFTSEKIEKYKDTLDTNPIGFQISPRINAVGRLDDAAYALDLLMAKDANDGMRLATILDDQNILRKAETDRILTEAISIVESKESLPDFIVIGKEDWHPGLVGIVAGRIRERYGRPAFILGLDKESGCMKGSARSIPGVNVGTAFQEYPDLAAGGGHAGAAGGVALTKDISLIEIAFSEYARNQVLESEFGVKLLVDLELRISELDLREAKFIQTFAPFGQGNPEPIFCLRDVKIVDIKPLSEGRFAKIEFQQGNSNVATGLVWQEFEIIKKKLGDGPIDLIVKMNLSTYRGIETLGWIVTHII